MRLSGVVGLFLTLAGIVLLAGAGMPFRIRGPENANVKRTDVVLGWIGLLLIFAGSLLHVYPDRRTPDSTRGFAIRQEAVGPLLARLCAETELLQGERTCYRYEWSERVKKLAADTMGQEAKAINRDAEVEFPSESVVIYPDEGSRVLFEGCRAHACPTANVYFLVAPDGRSLDILWGSERGVKTLGPHAALLAEMRIYERLQEIKCRKMYPTLNPCKLP